jgi:hypothetical protein
MPVALAESKKRNELSALAQPVPTAQELMQAMVRLLHERMLKYHLGRFLLLEPARSLRCWCWRCPEGSNDAAYPHSAQSGHLRRAHRADNGGVDDVTKDPRYLACSPAKPSRKSLFLSLRTARLWAS